MKLVNDSTSVKIPVAIGNKNKSQIEILSPIFTMDDKIINEGSYGLPDTTLVKIIKYSQKEND